VVWQGSAGDRRPYADPKVKGKSYRAWLAQQAEKNSGKNSE